MSKIRDDFESELIFEEESDKGIIGKLKFAFAKSDFKNRNDRIYSERILKRESERINKQIIDSGIAGQLSHPIDGSTKLDKVSHVLTKISYDSKSKLANAEASILRTTKGRDLMVLIKQNLKGLGASMRGVGTVTDSKVNDDYKLSSIDLVMNPSFDVANISSENLIESGNQFFDEGIAGEISWEKFEGMLEKMLEKGYESVGKNYESDYTQFVIDNQEIYCDILKKKLEEENFKVDFVISNEEKKKLEEEKEINEHRLWEEAVSAGFLGNFSEYRKKILKK